MNPIKLVFLSILHLFQNNQLKAVTVLTIYFICELIPSDYF